MKEEWKEIIEKYNGDWYSITKYQKLSKEFIIEFKNELCWYSISWLQSLSEEFIREFQHLVDWDKISMYQSLSENFIREFQCKVDWLAISIYQTLSEDFILEFQDKLDWERISAYQSLSEDFIREFQDKVDWDNISEYQNLSEEFLDEFYDKIDIKIYKNIHRVSTLEECRVEMNEYAEKYGLEFNGEDLIAYRIHDQFGRGSWNKTIFYEEGKYYMDWHCDMYMTRKNSFGLGIWSGGNVKVKVNVKDWGVWLRTEDSKCRVWGFTVIGRV